MKVKAYALGIMFSPSDVFAHIAGRLADWKRFQAYAYSVAPPVPDHADAARVEVEVDLDVSAEDAALLAYISSQYALAFHVLANAETLGEDAAEGLHKMSDVMNAVCKAFTAEHFAANAVDAVDDMLEGADT